MTMGNVSGKPVGNVEDKTPERSKGIHRYQDDESKWFESDGTTDGKGRQIYRSVKTRKKFVRQLTDGKWKEYRDYMGVTVADIYHFKADRLTICGRGAPPIHRMARLQGPMRAPFNHQM